MHREPLAGVPAAVEDPAAIFLSRIVESDDVRIGDECGLTRVLDPDRRAGKDEAVMLGRPRVLERGIVRPAAEDPDRDEGSDKARLVPHVPRV